MLTATFKLSQARNSAPFESSRSALLPGQHRSLTRSYSSKGIPISPDSKWNVITKPYKHQVRREQVQTKRKVALKYGSLSSSLYPKICALSAY